MVEGGGLENRFPERERGFESYSLRHILLTKCGEISPICFTNWRIRKVICHKGVEGFQNKMCFT